MPRKMRAYGEMEHTGKYVLEDYQFSRNHTKGVTIRRWKRTLKKKARSFNRRMLREERMTGGCRYAEKEF